MLRLLSGLCSAADVLRLLSGLCCAVVVLCCNCCTWLLLPTTYKLPTLSALQAATPTHHTPLRTSLPPQACGPCEPGKKCGGSGASRFADLCAPGSASNLWGGESCATCQGLTAAITSGAVKCQECAAGTTPSTDKKTCVLCPTGTYNTRPGDACQSCPAGTYREADGGDGTECTPCSPGSWSAAGAGECTLCQPGYAAPNENSTACDAW